MRWKGARGEGEERGDGDVNATKEQVKVAAQVWGEGRRGAGRGVFEMAE